jgi:hypothetical protein
VCSVTGTTVNGNPLVAIGCLWPMFPWLPSFSAACSLQPLESRPYWCRIGYYGPTGLELIVSALAFRWLEVSFEFLLPRTQTNSICRLNYRERVLLNRLALAQLFADSELLSDSVGRIASTLAGGTSTIARVQTRNP